MTGGRTGRQGWACEEEKVCVPYANRTVVRALATSNINLKKEAFGVFFKRHRVLSSLRPFLRVPDFLSLNLRSTIFQQNLEQ